ncbi:TPA: hypothetical protein SMF68_002002 [Serratia marcescens]|uniref:hypothetical protein n=1 Tax=Serratia TaxID=613 RepID=UPI0013EB1E9E|nr:MULTISPECIES: hypothetical protein [Serratia]EGS5643881.1 hypothetical protein [Serratia marcescens]EIJ9189434.1 hypothetical protein [Serratia marcescens]MBH2523022.1 hypothetical protein [Serratia marcescens]MBH2621058.1 hypothetical protein [Serratia marcescens]MBH2783285.1 hypothetical protein [Serratia marcescens]
MNEQRQAVSLRLEQDLVRRVERERTKLERRTGIRPSRTQVIEKLLNQGLLRSSK